MGEGFKSDVAVRIENALLKQTLDRKQAEIDRLRRALTIQTARLRNVVGWREADWPEGFCRATAEMVAELASPPVDLVDKLIADLAERGAI